MTRKAVFLDVDGTYVNDRGVVPESARRAVDGSRHSKARLRQLVYGDVRDEDVLAELEKGLGPFIDSLVDDQDLIRADINKVSFLGSDVPIETIRAEFAGHLDVIPVTVPMFGANSGEMSIPGIHKATAIELLLARAGISRQDTIAYGDGLNDLEMIEFVHMGIAMGNAHPRLKAAADSVTGDPDQDGIHTSFTTLGLI